MQHLAFFQPSLSTAIYGTYSGVKALQGNLSTSVEGIMWISVYKHSLKHLGVFTVDKEWIKPVSYTQVIHSFSGALKHWKCTLAKKKLDQLSTYSQSLLKLLSKKFELK